MKPSTAAVLAFALQRYPRLAGLLIGIAMHPILSALIAR